MKNFFAKIIGGGRAQNKLIVLYASKTPTQQVVEILARREDSEFWEAFTAKGVLRGAKAHLVIMGEFLETEGISRQQIVDTLESASRVVVQEGAFLEDPGGWIEQAKLVTARDIKFYPSRRIFFVSGTGGVGQTTLAYSAARLFQGQTGLKAAVVEMGAQSTVCEASLNPNAPDFYDFATNAEAPAIWNGITVVPALRERSSVLASERVLAAWERLARNHSLLVVDGQLDHPLWKDLLAEGVDASTSIFVVSDTRDHSVLSADRLVNQMGHLSPVFVLNKVNGMADTVGLRRRPEIQIRRVSGDRFHDDRMGRAILSHIYPNWK